MKSKQRAVSGYVKKHPTPKADRPGTPVRVRALVDPLAVLGHPARPRKRHR